VRRVDFEPANAEKIRNSSPSPIRLFTLLAVTPMRKRTSIRSLGREEARPAPLTNNVPAIVQMALLLHSG